MKMKFGRWFIILIVVLVVFLLGYKLIIESVGKDRITDKDLQISFQEQETLMEEEKSDNTKAQTTESDQSEKIAVEALAEDFAQAYFSGNKETLRRYLTDFNGVIDTSPYKETSIVSFKGLNDLPYGVDGARGSIWVEFKIPEMDSYIYLTLMLVRVDGIWKVEAYGLEM